MDEEFLVNHLMGLLDVKKEKTLVSVLHVA
jgi:hypothetical protein